MLIPKYWAQYKQRFASSPTTDQPSKQATIKRYGWSDISQSDALNHAKARVSEAYGRWLVGEDVLRRERREEYNASNGIPIREQIISQQFLPSSAQENVAPTQLVVTRNSYGAQVANVDNIAIIDVDYDDLLCYRYPEQYSHHGFMPALLLNKSTPSSTLNMWIFIVLFAVVASVFTWLGLSWLWLLVVMIGTTTYLWQQASRRNKARLQQHHDNIASLRPYMTDLLQKRVTRHPAEQFRLYETPKGFRIIVTHDIVLPKDSVVAEWFEYFHADANYVRLSQVQQCFRARLTAKPWRMTEVEDKSLNKDIPAKEFWFGSNNTDADNSTEQRQDELKVRKQWITDYEGFTKGYRACRYVETFSGRASHNHSAQTAIDEFIQWHDRVCQVDKDLPLA